MRINWNHVEVYTTDIVDGFPVEGLNRHTAQAVIDMAARRGTTASLQQTGETGSGREVYTVARV